MLKNQDIIDYLEQNNFSFSYSFRGALIFTDGSCDITLEINEDSQHIFLNDKTEFYFESIQINREEGQIIFRSDLDCQTLIKDVEFKVNKP